MRYKALRDKEKRDIFASYELERKCHKIISTNQFLKLNYKLHSKCYLQKNKAYSVRLKNYCSISGRSGGMVRKFKISRHCFKNYAGLGYLAGIRKSSW